MTDLGEIDWDSPLSDSPLNRGLLGCWLPGIESPCWGTRILYDVLPKGSGVGGYHGVPQAGATWKAAGLAVDGGVAGYATLPNGCVATAAGTLVFHARMDFAAASLSNLFLLNSGTGTQIAAWYDSSRQWTMYYGGSRASSAAQSFAAGTWQHLAFVYDSVGGDHAVYINGVSAGTGSATYSPSAPGALLLGTFSAGNGAIAATYREVRTYSRALPAAEVALLYDQSRRGHPDTLRRRSRVVWFVPQDEAFDPAAGFPWPLTAPPAACKTEVVAY